MKFLTIVPTNTNFDFIGKFKYFIVMSIAVGIMFIFGLYTKGLNYGVDFTGGSVVQVKYSTPTDSETVRRELLELGEKDASVVATGTAGTDYMITAPTHHLEHGNKPLSQQLVDKVGADKLTVVSVDVVGPKVGAELKAAAVRSLFYSVILITLYIWLRFDVKFAPGATVAMVHDLIMCAGFYLVTGREFTITAIAALLTIAGYSVNDTIVVYDRVREMYRIGGDTLPLAETINKAINITLSRTLLTSGVTLISVLPIIFLCKGEIQSFACAMAFGIFVGTYSTIYIASPLTIYVAKYLDKKEGRSRARPATA